MAALIPKGTGASTGGVTAHSALTGLQGGGVGEYYHLTLADYTAILALIASTSREAMQGWNGAAYEAMTDSVGDIMTGII